jgi:hypothetical protein
MIVHDVQQGSDEWKSLRAGKFTASGIPTLFMGKTTKGYNEYLLQIARERVTGKPVESFKSDWMKRGNSIEDDAINKYRLDTFQTVKTVGFIECDEWTGFSPDALVDDDGLLQVKCPKWNTFHNIKTIKDVDNDYIIQCQAELLFSDREWNDLYFYDPELEPKNFRIYPDHEVFFGSIIGEIEIAKEKVMELMKNIKLRSV